MAKSFVIKTDFRAADKFSPVLKKLGIRVDQTGRRIDRSFRRATKSASVFGGVLKGVVVAGAIQRGAMAANLAIRSLSDEFLEFDKNITKAVARIPGGMDRSSDAFKRFSNIARVEAAKTEFTAGQTAQAVEQLSLAGFSVEQTASTLPGVLKLATNAEVEVADATRMATKTLGAFGLRTKDNAQLVTNMTRVNDAFSVAISSASLNMEDLFEVLKFGGPAARAAGQDIETFAVLTGVLADSSVDASIAGTSLRSMFLSLAAPVPKASNLIKKLKLNIFDANGDFNDFVDIVGQLEKATSKMGEGQRLATLKILFGKRAVNAADILIRKGVKGLNEYRDSVRGAGGASDKMSKTIRQSLAVRLGILKSALVELGFKFIQAFGGKTGKTIDDLIKSVNRFDVKPVVAALKEIFTEMRNLFNFIRENKQEIKVLAGAFIGLKVGIKAVMAIESVAFFKSLAIALGSSATEGTAAATAMVSLKAGLTKLFTFTLPVLGVFAALGAVVAIVATDFEAVTLGLAEGMLRVDRFFKNFLIGAISRTKQLLNAMMPLFEFLGVGDFVKTSGFEALDNIIVNTTKDVKGLTQAIKDIEVESLSNELKVKGFTVFGDQNVRGLGLPGVPKQPTIAQKRLSATGFNPLASAIARAPRQPRAPQAPNRSDGEASQQKFEGTMRFENAPKGSTFSQRKGPGLSQLRTEGLGSQ
jgi:TP901 family phage tail tape measure protein